MNYQITTNIGQLVDIGEMYAWYSWRYRSNLIGQIQKLIIRRDRSVWAQMKVNREYASQVKSLKNYPVSTKIYVKIK